MRVASGIVLVLVLLSACGGSAKPPTLPLLPTEPAAGSVAQFPCPMHPSTTLEIETCSAKSVLALNRRIDTLRRTIWSRLLDRSGRADFADGELAWQKHVGEECTTVSEDPLCELRLGEAHVRELTRTAAGRARR
jgi:hypothetical protein